MPISFRTTLPILLLASAACGLSDATSERQATREEAVTGLAPWVRLEGAEVVSAFVVLEGEPAAAALGGAPVGSPDAIFRARKRLAEIEAQHNLITPSLLAEGAEIVADLSRLVNAIQIRVAPEALVRVARLPGVVRLDPVDIYERSTLSAVPFIGAPLAWASAVPLQGDGIRIGIIDSGIDYTHSDFGEIGDAATYSANDPTLIEPGTFPTARVIGGYDFAGDAYDASKTGSASSPKPDADPLDCAQDESMQVAGGHGTHVSGIAAGGGVLQDGAPFLGPYEQSLDPNGFRVGPGVAPRASLYALKVFGCQGSTGLLNAALDRASDPNLDGDFSDRLDVVNASLGSPYALGSKTQATAIANLTAVGTLFVAAAGNEGGSFFAAGAPGTVPETLSVAATQDTRFAIFTVASPSEVAGEIPAAESAFTQKLTDAGALTAQLIYASPIDGCAALDNTSAMAGNIALIDRGTCTFVEKVQRAAKAGAIAAVIVDNEDSDVPLTMTGTSFVNLPGVLIRKASGDALKPSLAGGVTVTLDGSIAYAGPGSEPIVPFSSRGPGGDSGALKPDIGAPGLGIDSAQVGTGFEPRNSSGTSMASPMVAGSAALVRQANPSLGPLDVKALLMNTAARAFSASGEMYPPSLVGAGGVRVLPAVTRHVTAAAAGTDGATSVSFGSIVTDRAASRERDVVIQNHGSVTVDYAVSIDEAHVLPGVTLGVSKTALSVGPGESAILTLSITVDPEALGAPGPDPLTPPTQFDYSRHFVNEATGHLVLTDAAGGAESLTLPFQASVRAAAKRQAKRPSGCVTAGAITVFLEGDSAHPSPATSAYELGVTDEENPQSATDPDKAKRDVVAVGAATSYATADSFETTTVSFGIAIVGEWTTPARGQVSAVGIDLDVDLDNKADFAIMAEPLTRDQPYADVLVATIYDLKTDTEIGQKRYLNLVPRSSHDTQPFFNSVLSLSFRPSDLGITEDAPIFAYAGFTQSPDSLLAGERTAFVPFDPTHPAIDTSKGGGGVPLFPNGAPVKAHLTPPGEGPLPRLLLLHHTNVAGARMEIVDLEGTSVTGLGNLVVTSKAKATLAPGEVFSIELTAKNEGKVSIPDATLSASLSGARLGRVTASAGGCGAGPFVACNLGEVAPGEAITVIVEGAVPSEATASHVVFGAEAGFEDACETSLDDNRIDGSIPIVSTDAGEDALEVSGGCGCSAPGSTPRAPNGFAGVLSLLALSLLRRSRSN